MSLVIENVRPLVEVFIQQGLPPEFLIPDAKNFDYGRFVNLFGNSLDRQDFDAHSENCQFDHFLLETQKSYLYQYSWSRTGPRKYTPEQAEQLFETIKKIQKN
jgi:hypothetical protein